MRTSIHLSLIALLASSLIVACGGGLSRTELDTFRQAGKLAVVGAPARFEVRGEPGQRAPAIEEVCQGKQDCSTEHLTWIWYDAPQAATGFQVIANTGFVYPIGVNHRAAARDALARSAKEHLGVELGAEGGAALERLASGLCFSMGFSNTGLVWCDSGESVPAEAWKALRSEGISAVFVGVVMSVSAVLPGQRVGCGGTVWIIDTATGKPQYKPAFSRPQGGEVDATRLAPFFPQIDVPGTIWGTPEAAVEYGKRVTRSPDDVKWLSGEVERYLKAVYDNHLNEMGK